MTLRNVSKPPIATISPPTQMAAIPPSTQADCNNVFHDFVPTHEETSHSGNKKATRSGRKPPPTPSAAAPHIANRFSPFQQRQQQYAVSKENRARFGRNGPSRLECQKTGFNNSNRTAAVPAQAENILFPIAKAAGRQSPLTSSEITTKLHSALWKKKLITRPNKTKSG